MSATIAQTHVEHQAQPPARRSGRASSGRNTGLGGGDVEQPGTQRGARGRSQGARGRSQGAARVEAGAPGAGGDPDDPPPGAGAPGGGGGAPGGGGGAPGGGGGAPGGGGGAPGGGGPGAPGGGGIGNPAIPVPLPDTDWVRMLTRLSIPQAAIRFIVITEGIDASEELIQFSTESVDRVFTRMDTQGILYSTVISNRFRLLHHYLRRMTFSGLPIVLGQITNDLMRDESVEVQAKPAKSSKSKLQAPAKFTDENDWASFSRNLANYLKSFRGAGGVPMVYLIRPDNPALAVGVNTDPAIANAPLTGPMYQQDNRELYCLLVELTNGGPGITHVRRFESSNDGRSAYWALDSNFNGGSFKLSKAKRANDVLKTLKYTGVNQNISFETFHRKWADAIRDLEECGQGLSQEKQVLDFLDAISMAELQPAVNHVYADEVLLKNFNKAATFLAGIAVKFKIKKDQSSRGVSSVDMRLRTAEEWKKLSSKEKEAIIEARNSNRKGTQDQKRKVSSMDKKPKAKMSITDKMDGILKKRTKGSKFPKRKVASANSDQEDDADVDEESVEEEVYTPLTEKYARGKKVRFKKAVYVRNILSISRGEGRAELDSHADNCIFGSDGRVLEEYPESYTVYGYDGSSGTERTLTKLAVAHDDEEGKTVVLIFDQVFHEPKMMNSLINPNQLRDYGLVVEDTPTRYNSSSAHAIFAKLEDGSQYKIQLKSHGYVSYFDVRYPTDDELENCLMIECTAGVWNPDSPSFSEAEKAARDVSTISVDLRSYKPTSIDVETLAKRWSLKQDLVRATLQATTIYASRTLDEPRYMRYGQRFRWLGRLRLSSNFYTDTFFCLKSKAGHTCAQIFINDLRFMFVVPMTSKGEAPYALRVFLDTVGLPQEIVSDNSWEQTSKLWISTLREFGIQNRQIATYSPWMNYAENGVKALKFRCARIIEEKGVHPLFWDHLTEYCATLHTCTSHKTFRLSGRTPYEATLGRTPDISSLVDFGFYDWVWFIKPKDLFPSPKRSVGRWLGPTKQISSDLSMRVLTNTARVIATTSVQPITQYELENPQIKAMIDNYESSLKSKLSDEVRNQDPLESLGIAKDFPSSSQEDSRMVASSSKTERTEGKKADRAILDNYITEALSRHLESYDDLGYKVMDIDQILDHYHVRGDPAKAQSGANSGWYFLVQWKDGTIDIVHLQTIKESHPILVAEYCRDHGLQYLPGLSWWVPYTLRKAKRIASITKNNKTIKREKYGVHLPRTVEEALSLDKKNGNNLWRNAIDKEMKNIQVALEILPKGKRPNPGYKQIKCHLIFDVKVDLTRKARFVAGGHMNHPPQELTYSTVASRDSIRILLLVASLNQLSVLVTDIQNAYLAALPREKVYFIAGPELGTSQGRYVIVVRALYGLKTSGAAFRSKLADDLRAFGYSACLSDNDVYIKRRYHPKGYYYWEYIIVYVDDVICISHAPEEFMKKLAEAYKLKNGYDKPDTYLGMQLKDTDQGWLVSMNKYILNILKEQEEKLLTFKMKLPKSCRSVLPSGYRPESDDSEILDESWTTWYQGIIGILRWLVEMGRIDLSFGVSLLSSYLNAPRIGHFRAALHVLSYVKGTAEYSLLLSPQEPDLKSYAPIDINRWKDYYPNAREEIPPDLPESLAEPVVISVYVDADHAGDESTRRSHTGIVIYLNSAPIVWYSKKQTTVETSSYGSELVAMRTAVELTEGLRYKLRSFGVPIAGPAYVFCDNQSVVFSTSTPESALKKKHSSIAYHKVREYAASGAIRVFKITSEENVADLLTKLCNGPRTTQLCLALGLLALVLGAMA